MTRETGILNIDEKQVRHMYPLSNLPASFSCCIYACMLVFYKTKNSGTLLGKYLQNFQAFSKMRIQALPCIKNFQAVHRVSLEKKKPENVCTVDLKQSKNVETFFKRFQFISNTTVLYRNSFQPKKLIEDKQIQKFTFSNFSKIIFRRF